MELSPKHERLAHHADQELSWLSIGIDITVVSVTPPLRWTPKLSKRTKKSSKRKKLLWKPRETPKQRRLPIKPQPEKPRRTLKRQEKRNDYSIPLSSITESILN
jgi:hypothetical protein